MGGTLDDESTSGRANATTNASPARFMTGGMGRGSSDLATAAVIHIINSINSTADPTFAMTRKTSSHPSDSANVDGTEVSVRGATVSAGGSDVPADGSDVSGSGVEVIGGSSA